jgi:N-acetylglutamate synthase-like GNAT family acetyltransferase
MPVFMTAPPRDIRRRHGLRYARLRFMQRVAVAPFSARFPQGMSTAWLARRWYYTPRSRRAYSVRQASPGDRRLLAEFMLSISATASERDRDSLQELSSMLFDRVIAAGNDTSVAFTALENTQGGDRVIGVCAYVPSSHECAAFAIAVANSFREEQVGRTLLSTLLRHAKRVGVRRLAGEMTWSNRPMQMLAASMGFSIGTSQRDRNRRVLVLDLK